MLVSFWKSLFSGAMLVSGSVYLKPRTCCSLQKHVPHIVCQCTSRARKKKHSNIPSIPSPIMNFTGILNLTPKKIKSTLHKQRLPTVSEALFLQGFPWHPPPCLKSNIKKATLEFGTSSASTASVTQPHPSSKDACYWLKNDTSIDSKQCK